MSKINAEFDVDDDHSGGRSGRRVDYGRTYVVRPKGRHQATIVWLHGLGDNGARYCMLLSQNLLTQMMLLHAIRMLPCANVIGTQETTHMSSKEESRLSQC